MLLRDCDIYEIKKKTHDKKLICFGMGKVLHDFLEDFREFALDKDIYAIADNKVEEKNQFITINNVRIRLISVQEILEINDEIIILISCADICGVYEQLNQYDKLKKVVCYAVHFIRSRTNKTDEESRIYPQTFRILKEAIIPKIIHYCWFGGNTIPDKNLEWIESWKKYCPDYKIIRWDESNYDVTKNNYMYEAYRKEKWGFVSDYARVDIIYEYGGIYLDTDVEIIKCLDELLYQQAFCGIESNRRIALGLGFGSVKKSTLMKDIMDMYDKINFVDKNGNLNLTTCVQLQYSVFKKNGFITDGNYQIFNGMTVLPEKVLSPKDLYTGEITIKKNTFSIHHYDASWVDEKKRKKTEDVKKLYSKIQTTIEG